MPGTLAFILKNKMSSEIRVGLIYIILDLFAQVANNKNEFCNACFTQLIYDKTQNSFTRNRDQSFGLRIGMRPQFCSCTGHRYNRFHGGSFSFENSSLYTPHTLSNIFQTHSQETEISTICQIGQDFGGKEKCHL